VKEIEALVILSAVPTLGPIKIRLLLNHFGSALQAIQADADAVRVLPGFGSRILENWGCWKKNKSWEKTLELADNQGVKIIPFTDKRYPKRLLDLPDAPILLYVKGDILPSDARSLAVVGTRHCGLYGSEMAEKISQDLAAAGFTVVSGLARGIDTAAHRGALRKGRTFAVIGSGLADIYPQENIPLSEKIALQGALISEFPMDAPPDRQNFPQRNRIVSGMTMGTVLVEAPLRSGAMITMEKAYSQERKLFAIPGRIDNDTFQGNHLLIKSGKAQLIENARDIIGSFEDLFGAQHNIVFHQTKETRVPLEFEEQQLLSKLPNEELTIDEMANLTKLPIIKLNVLLMSLVLKQAIKEYPGKIYKKKS